MPRSDASVSPGAFSDRLLSFRSSDAVCHRYTFALLVLQALADWVRDLRRAVENSEDDHGEPDPGDIEVAEVSDSVPVREIVIDSRKQTGAVRALC